ncbi:MAG: PEP-CTERM sorting domain-containing protein [Planctomycetota bacterium]
MSLARTLAALSFAALAIAPASAQITDFNAWTLIQDPPDPDLAATIATDGSKATLTATAPVARTTSIGLASINGQDVASSTQGFFFDPANSFKIAVDFDARTNAQNPPDTVFLFGFGVGEATDRDNSVTTVFTWERADFFPTFFSVVDLAMVDGRSQWGSFLSASPGQGSLFVQYDAESGDVFTGFASDVNATNPEIESAFPAIQNDWDEKRLIVSIYLHGGTGDNTTGGGIEATFSNFRVLDGTPIAIPEPASLTLLAAAAGLALTRRRA